MRHRVYDPVPGPAGMRWLQRDPAFFVDGLNLYAYCGGDPVNGVDPLGLGPWDAIKETVAGLGYATGWFQPSVPQPWTDSAPMSDPSDHYQQAQRLQRIRSLRDRGAELSDEQIARIREANKYHKESTHGDQQSFLDNLSETPVLRDRVLDGGHSKRLVEKTIAFAAEETLSLTIDYALAGFGAGGGAGGCSDELFAAGAASIGRKAAKGGKASAGGVVGEAATAGPRGGTYLLRDPKTGKVMRSGRTNDLKRRAGEHGRDPALEDLAFEPVHRTDSYEEQRGLEQLLHDRYDPPLNKANPIDPRNKRRQEYLDAAQRHLNRGTTP